jgi:hypothetical protein
MKFKTFTKWNSCRKIQLGDKKLLQMAVVVRLSNKMPNFPFVREKACEMLEFTIRFETVSRK